MLTFLRAFVRDFDLRILFKSRLALENKGNLKHISLEVEKQESSSNGQKEKWRDRARAEEIIDHVYYMWPRSTYVPMYGPMDRCIGRYIGRLSTDYRSTIDRL